MNTNSGTRFRRIFYALPALAAAFVSLPADAATRFWTGASALGGNWTLAANWQGNVAPVAGDTLQFVEPGARKTSNTNNFPAGTTFARINFVAANTYRLRGNRVTITNSVNVDTLVGSHLIDLDLTLGGPATIPVAVFDAAASLTLNGDVNLNGRTLRTEDVGEVTIAGIISGNGNLSKLNQGELILAGLGANTFNGATTVTVGTLRLNRYTLSGGLTFVGATAIPGDLTIGDIASLTTVVSDIAVLDRDNQIADTSAVTVYANGRLELSDESDTVGNLNLRGGTVTTGTGVLAVDGGIQVSDPLLVNKDSSIAGRLNLGSRGDGAQIVDVSIQSRLNISAQISGVTTTDLVKTNGGRLFLTASNIFSGDLEIKGGTVIITDGHALGTTNGVTRLMGGSLNLDAATSFGIQEALESVHPNASFNEVRLLDGNVAWLGNILLPENVIFEVDTNETLSVSGKISGPGGWTKTGPGTLQFKTTHTNNYEGSSVVVDGNFIMDGVFHQPVVPGRLRISSDDDGTITRAWMIKNNQIADTAEVSVSQNGVLDLAGFNDTVGSLELSRGTIETGGGTLTLNGDIACLHKDDVNDEPAHIHGRLALGGVTRTIRGSPTGLPNLNTDLIITATISDGGAAAGLIKERGGSVQLAGSNTFSGPVSITDGTLIVSHSSALGTTAGGTTVSGTNGAKIFLQPTNGNLIILEPLTLNSTGPGSPVALENFIGLNQWNGPITLLAPENTISVLSIPRTLALGGAISGIGGLKKVGPGHLTLNGFTTNSFAGRTVVAEGDLVLDKPTTESINGDLTIGDGVGGMNADRVRIRGLGDEVWNGSRVVINSSGQLILEAVLDLVGSIEGSGNILMTNTVTSTGGLIVGRNDLSTAFAGVMSGNGNFSKTGLGTLRLTANHPVTGPMSVHEGRLEIDGSIAASSHLLVARNPPEHIFFGRVGTLGGRGSVPRVYNWAGEVSPGVNLPTGTARLQVQGHYESTNGVFRVQLNGTTPGTGYDQLRVTGNVDLGTIHSSPLLVTAGFAPTTNDVFVIIDKLSPGPVVGTFNNLPDGAVLGGGFDKFQIRYTGGDGNDVTLRRVEIPGSNITSIAPDGGEKMTITGLGCPFVTYVLEATMTLTSPIPWTPVATNTANALGIYQFTEAYVEAGLNLYPARFFRVQSP